MLKRLMRHTFLYGVTPQIAKIIGFIFLPIITQYLTPVDFGIYGVVQAYVVAFSFLKTLGLDYHFANVFIKRRRKYLLIWSSLYGFLIVWSIIIALILGAILFFTISDEFRDLRWAIILLNCVPIAFYSTTENLFFRYYQLKEKPGKIAFRTLIVGLTNVSISLIGIIYLDLGFMAWFIANFISMTIGFIISLASIWSLVRPTFNLNSVRIKSYLSLGLPILPHYYGNYLLDSSDRVVMDLIQIDTSDIGRYNISYQIANSLNIASSAVKKASGPILLKYYNEGLQGKKKARLLTFKLQVIFLAITFIIVTWSSEILSFLIRNEQFGDNALLFSIIILAFNYVPMYSGGNSQLFFHNKVKNLWKRALVAGLINIVINILFLPEFGIITAAVSSYISYMYLGYSTFYMKDYKATDPLNYYPLAWILLTVIVSLVSITLSSMALEVKLIVTFMIAPLVIIVLRYFDKLNVA